MALYYQILSILATHFFLLCPISLFLTVWLSYLVVQAWNWLTASDGDTLTYTKWNELVTIVWTNTWKLSNIYSNWSNIWIWESLASKRLHVTVDDSSEILRMERDDSSINVNAWDFRIVQPTWTALWSLQLKPADGFSNADFMVTDKDDNVFFLVDDSGKVGIWKTNPSTKLDVDWTVTATSFVWNGASLTGISDTLGDLSCSVDQIAKWNGTAWVCTDQSSGGSLSCSTSWTNCALHHGSTQNCPSGKFMVRPADDQGWKNCCAVAVSCN